MTTTSAEQQDYIASVRESLEDLEEKLAVAGYRREQAQRTMELIERQLPGLALRALDGEESASREYSELSEELERQERIVKMADRDIPYGEQMVDSYRKALRGEYLRQRLEAEKNHEAEEAS